MELDAILEKNGLKADAKKGSDGTAEHRFYVSDSVERFKELASSILPCDTDYVEYVNPETYGSR